uniref:AlNc14C101G6026 protein n=1 Tax=Albugo laibachii Nc14 TaxID=890382 RepID=F0WHG3_9STRA|nr:AlNc14C101G6026 [Albugo laibachii Nc14]|eukprot:CCA20682.1 AlNc14C101G6026 [Albugo laibachii Nc14]
MHYAASGANKAQGSLAHACSSRFLFKAIIDTKQDEDTILNFELTKPNVPALWERTTRCTINFYKEGKTAREKINKEHRSDSQATPQSLSERRFYALGPFYSNVYVEKYRGRKNEHKYNEQVVFLDYGMMMSLVPSKVYDHIVEIVTTQIDSLFDDSFKWSPTEDFPCDKHLNSPLPTIIVKSPEIGFELFNFIGRDYLWQRPDVGRKDETHRADKKR